MKGGNIKTKAASNHGHVCVSPVNAAAFTRLKCMSKKTIPPATTPLIHHEENQDDVFCSIEVLF